MFGWTVLLAVAAAQTPAHVAFLVDAADPAVVAPELSAALTAPDPLLRAAAARVATVRNATAILPELREALSRESDSNAMREEARALAILGYEQDIDRMIAPAHSLPPPMIDVIARAVARRNDAFDIYIAKLRPVGFAADPAFFTQLLWQRARATSIAARTLGTGDRRTWRALLDALRSSALAVDTNVLGAALNSRSEEIRTDSVWYLVHGYAFDPSKINEHVRAALAEPSEEASLREAFGRELLRRMLGGERKDDPRFLAWLQTEEADALIGSEIGLFEYFTDREFAARKNHCDIASNDCRIPAQRKPSIPSTPVAQPSFMLPGVLPPGLAEAVVREGGCRNDWLGTARATVDEAGRVRELVIDPVAMDKNCQHVVATLMRLSLATPDSIAAPREASNLLLIHSAGMPICLDEAPPTAAAVTYEVGGGIEAPVVKHKVQPQFPEGARQRMGRGQSAMVTVEATITKEGCVRNIRLVAQSPFPDMNGAAVVAMSKWTFAPGRLRGEPVDVLFHLTINFRL
jgi:TonB family protein